MKSEYKIIDNVFSPEQFEDLVDYVEHSGFPWYHSDSVAYDEQNESPSEEDELTFNVPLTDNQKEYNFMFGHSVFADYEIGSTEVWNLILPIFNIASIKSLIRCKINSYPKTHELVHHKDHLDYSFKHKGAIFYINSNDGLTVLEDGTEIESVANRLLLFNPSQPHHSTTCTNANRRMNINFNYF